ncbi:MAG: hypothetical protein H6745_15215 [Deltaproteobacteria bacterium]|nr:hypothetical protein [Deltaproteobacteria bacterium]
MRAPTSARARLRAAALTLAFTAGLAGLPLGCGDGSDAGAGPDGAGTADTDGGPDDVPADTAQADADADATALVATPGALRWDLAAARADDFFAFPYPSAARVDAAGHPDLASFRTDLALVDMLADAIAFVEDDMTGFGPLSVVYVPFAEDVDPDTLPADAAASLAPEATVFLVDLGPGAHRGERYPVSVAWTGAGGGYVPPRTLAIRPLYEVPPRPGTRLAAVVTRGVTGPGGAALAAPSVVADLDAWLAVAAPPDDALALAPLREAAGDLGLAWGDVLAATVYETADPTADLAALAGWIRAEAPRPEATDLAAGAPYGNQTGYTVVEGVMPSFEVLDASESIQVFGAGRIAVGADGEPATRTPVALRFALSLPPGDPPAGGWPIVLYGHGLGEDYRGFLRTAARALALRGIACIGLDPPLQGARNRSGQDDRTLIVTLSVSNVVAGREILRQGVVDLVQLERLVGGLAVPAELTGGGAVAATFDTGRLGYMGHSEGAQIGALYLPLAPAVRPAIFSEGGGGAAITMLELKLEEIDVAATIASLLGVDPAVETLGLDHPLASVVIQPLLDRADPLHSARRLVREAADGEGHDLVMLEGFLDPLTPPPSIEALASAAGLPIAEPVGRAIPGLDLQGIAAAPLPASDNLAAPGGARTGGLIQLPDDDHYIIYFNQAVRTQLFDFMASALGTAGDGPTLSPRPAE